MGINICNILMNAHSNTTLVDIRDKIIKQLLDSEFLIINFIKHYALS